MNARVLGAILAFIIMAAALVWLPVADGLTAVVEMAEQAGPLGAVLYALLYAVAVVLLIPGSVLTVGAGLVYGPVVGLMVVWPGAVTGAIASFLLGRGLLRDQVEARVSAEPTFAAIDSAVGEDGLTLVTLLRLSPVFPFGLLNYGLGLTGVSTRDYSVATVFGILPGTFLYVYLGSTLSSLGQFFDGSAPPAPGQQLLYWGGLLATVAVTVQVTRRARQALEARIPPAEGTS